jgi:hypothetical protein
MLVTETDGVEKPGVKKFLETFESSTHREPEAISSWYDETRHTKMYQFAPPTPATAPATTAPAH